MKKIISSLIVLIIIASAVYFSSCRREDSVNINQDRIFTNYELEYNSDANQTKARATFRIGGEFESKIKLSEGSSIRFNNADMDFKSIYAYYQDELTGLRDTGTFVFKDLDGNSFTNTATMYTVEFPDTVDDLVKGATYEIVWNGPALKDKETIKLTVDGPLESDDKHFEVSATGATSLTLSSSETSSLNAGANILELERIYESYDVNAPSVGGKIKTTYKAINHAINVTE